MERPKGPCPRDLFSEMKDNYRSPKLKKPTATRVKCFEQFLWQELFQEYIRYNDDIINMPLPKPVTEYYEEYCKHMPPEDLTAKQQLMDRFPVYCTSAITLWNHTGDVTKDFKKRYSITRPVHMQRQQFG